MKQHRCFFTASHILLVFYELSFSDISPVTLLLTDSVTLSFNKYLSTCDLPDIVLHTVRTVVNRENISRLIEHPLFYVHCTGKQEARPPMSALRVICLTGGLICAWFRGSCGFYHPVIYYLWLYVISKTILDSSDDKICTLEWHNTITVFLHWNNNSCYNKKNTS